MPVEPLNLSLARSDAAQQVQNLFAQADRAGRAAAGQEGRDVGAKDATSVNQLDAAQGARIREEETGGSGTYEGPPHPPKSEEKPEESPSEDPEGKGRKIDIQA
ncbi:MAG: hypothetical protein FD180_2613 [Planctomycetota bacterium]|nr:MAG: hypothetical protein FD180_2613 [Planctomycetota bacterium]